MEYMLANFFQESKTSVNTTSNSMVINNYKLEQNYPNPFNPSTIIAFALPKTAFVTLKVYNLIGEEVAALVSAKQPAGNYKVEWDATNFSSGVYFYKLTTDHGFIQTRKLVVLK